MARKTIAVDSDMIDRATDELVETYISTRKEPEDNEEGTKHH
ncbi:MAG TPA: hypothetical protein VIP56_08930 [Nitrososphaeraceae archaeon]